MRHRVHRVGFAKTLYPPKRVLRMGIGLAVASLVTTIPALGQFGDRALVPGQTLLITSPANPMGPDAVGDDCFQFLLATCVSNAAGTPPGARTIAASPFARATSMTYQFYSFEVTKGRSPGETPLLTQISGSADLRGFLALVGVGQVQSSLVLKVVDIGKDADPTNDPTLGRVVHRLDLASHELLGQLSPTITGAVGADVGIPHGGSAGVSVGFGFSVGLQKELVSDTIDFGFSVLLQRGHHYRLLLELHTNAKRGGLKGSRVPPLVIAQFDGSAAIPNLMDPAHWLSAVEATMYTGQPNLGVPVVQGIERNAHFSWAVDPFTRVNLQNIPPRFPRPQASTHQVLGARNLPVTVRDLVENRLSPPSDVEEALQDPGFQLRDLALTMQHDDHELLEEIKRALTGQRTP